MQENCTFMFVLYLVVLSLIAQSLVCIIYVCTMYTRMYDANAYLRTGCLDCSSWTDLKHAFFFFRCSRLNNFLLHLSLSLYFFVCRFLFVFNRAFSSTWQPRECGVKKECLKHYMTYFNGLDFHSFYVSLFTENAAECNEE